MKGVQEVNILENKKGNWKPMVVRVHPKKIIYKYIQIWTNSNSNWFGLVWFGLVGWLVGWMTNFVPPSPPSLIALGKGRKGRKCFYFWVWKKI
jgi:hypothetical protein